jgi:hypothetical protein
MLEVLCDMRCGKKAEHVRSNLKSRVDDWEVKDGDRQVRDKETSK